MDIEGLPRLTRRTGDKKRKLECDDILNYFSFADGQQVTLPTFVASKLDRVPSVSPGDVDIYALAASVASVTAQLDALTKRMDLVASSNDLESMNKRLSVVEASRCDFPPLIAGGAASAMVIQPPPTAASSSSTVSQSWTAVAGEGPVELNNPRPHAVRVTPPPAVRVKGSSAAHTRVKAVPRKPIIAAFVSRMDPATTPEDLTDLLSAAGIDGIVCKKVLPKMVKCLTLQHFLCHVGLNMLRLSTTAIYGLKAQNYATGYFATNNGSYISNL